MFLLFCYSVREEGDRYQKTGLCDKTLCRKRRIVSCYAMAAKEKSGKVSLSVIGQAAGEIQWKEQVKRIFCMVLSMEELKRMQSMHIMDLKREELTDIADIRIDTEKCVESRIRSFLEQTNNPFAMNVGEYILQVGFMEGATDLIDDRMVLLAKRKTQITV